MKMKIFNAADFVKQPGKVYREADKNGSAKINHDRYPDKVFIIHAVERGKSIEREES